jgi:hypothetical protein
MAPMFCVELYRAGEPTDKMPSSVSFRMKKKMLKENFDSENLTTIALIADHSQVLPISVTFL